LVESVTKQHFEALLSVSEIGVLLRAFKKNDV